MKTFNEHYDRITAEYISSMSFVMKTRGIVYTFPKQMVKKIKELRDKSQKILKDSKFSEKEKQDMVAKYDEKIKEIQQSIVRFRSQHSM